MLRWEPWATLKRARRAVCLDVLIAQGLAVRKWDEKAGDYRYYDSAYALSSKDPQQKVN